MSGDALSELLMHSHELSLAVSGFVNNDPALAL